MTSKVTPASYDATLTLTPSRLSSQASALSEVDPETCLPRAFRVGSYILEPYVTVPELVQHLLFLACLHRLQQDVRECPTSDVGEDHQVPGDAKWAAFCTRAQQRFENWATSPNVQRIADRGCPITAMEIDAVLDGVNIDILMVWHTYCLNPSAYEEDTDRLGRIGTPFPSPLRGLNALGAFPLTQIRIDQETFVFQPFRLVPANPSEKASTAGENPWVPPPPAYSTHPINLIEIHPVNTCIDIRCPKCWTALKVPLLGPEERPRGFATNEFQWVCNCGMVINHEALRVDRFLQDLADFDNRAFPYLAGLGRAVARNVGTTPGITISACIVNAARLYSGTDYIDTVKLGAAAGWTFAGIRQTIFVYAQKHRLYRPVYLFHVFDTNIAYARKAMSAALRRLGRVYSGRKGLASIDLGAAVMRQAAFVGSMERIGWLNIDRWTKGTDPTRFYLLQKAAGRYHAFLDLMTANKGAFLSPTLDIDLGWHTHQLHGLRYAADTERLMGGKLIDHDDKVADVTLKVAYDKTATLWAARFGVPYSGCGCPTAKEAARKLDLSLQQKYHRPSGLKFWRVASARRRSLAEGHGEIAAMMSDMPAEERGATCPSTHNLVHIENIRFLAALRRRHGLGSAIPPDTEHASPFATRYVFVPRRVRGTRAFNGPNKSRDRSAAGTSSSDAYIYGYPMYWGVAPYAFGPWPICDPWCLNGDVNNIHGSCAGGTCAVGATGCAGSAGACGSGHGACGNAGGSCGGGSFGGCSGGGGGGGGGCGGGGGGGDGGGGGGGGCGGGS